MSFNKIYQLNKTLILKKILLVIIVFTVIGRISYCHKHTSGKLSENTKNRLLLYSTDLSVNGDFDDYFDLAVLSSLNTCNLPIIIVDGNDSCSKKTGVAAIQNLAKAIGKKQIANSVLIGRDENLSNFFDSQCNMELIEYLTKTDTSIDIVTVGSLRDIAALYNSSPNLFKSKVQNIYVFAGDAEGSYIEYNTGLDETAFLRIMNAGLNIYWIPCFQNGLYTTGNNASFVQIQHKEIFVNTDSKLLNWFLYRFEMSNMEFELYMNEEHDTMRFMEETRNIWCAPLFPLLNDSMDFYLQKYNEIYQENIKLPFGFSQQKVMFLEDGKVSYGEGKTIHLFEIYDYENYLKFCKFILQVTIGQSAIKS